MEEFCRGDKMPTRVRYVIDACETFSKAKLIHRHSESACALQTTDDRTVCRGPLV